MRIALPLALALVTVLSTSGCATIFTGSSDTITFNSEPSGARVLIDGIAVGRTPLTTSVDRTGFGSGKLVTLQLDGYDNATFELSNSFNVVSILNLGNLLGWGVDIITGAVTKYDRRFYTVEMDDGIISFNMDDLERTEDGALVVPPVGTDASAVTIVDEASGLQFVFEQ